MTRNNLKLADGFAEEYDKQIVQQNWNGPKILYEQLKSLIPPKSKILDLGIGTGESSVRFKKDGHIITGIDGSVKMLEVCKRKKFAADLILHNLEDFPFPIEKNKFDLVISIGVFHLIHLNNLFFSEVKNLLKSSGLFAFTFEDNKEIKNYKEINPGVWKMQTETGVITFKYSDTIIFDFLTQNNFEILDKKRFLAFSNTELQKDFYFTLLQAKLK